ncbi:hypothetical protein BJX70DRAFT_316679 [Aspergillus crustosus]
MPEAKESANQVEAIIRRSSELNRSLSGTLIRAAPALVTLSKGGMTRQDPTLQCNACISFLHLSFSLPFSLFLISHSFHSYSPLTPAWRAP